jgi:hypothetical protein
MSGERTLWLEGVAVVDLDLQRLADGAARADDLAAELVAEGSIGVTSVLRRVLPLEGTEDYATSAAQLLIQSVGGGILSIAPALYQAFLRDTLATVPRLVMGARSRQVVQTDPLSANPGGAPRTDLLYATVTQVNAAPQSRRFKAPSGAVSTQAIVLSSTPTVVFSVSEGSGYPAEGAGSYVFPLAEIVVPAGYTEFTTIDPSWIRQVWRRTFAPPFLHRAITGSAFGSGNVAQLTRVAGIEPDWGRFGGARKFCVPFRHVGDAATVFPLGDRVGAIDWRQRLVRFSLVRAVAQSTQYVPPHSVTAPGASVTEDSGYRYTGTASGTVWTSARGFELSMLGNALRISKPGGAAPDDGANGDCWLLVIETTDQFV